MTDENNEVVVEDSEEDSNETENTEEVETMRCERCGTNPCSCKGDKE